MSKPLAWALLLFVACETAPSNATVAATVPTPAQDKYAPRRAKMVRAQLAGRDITDKRVLEAMGRIPRHEFVPAVMKPSAYADRPLPIGHGVTISQPYIVALMTQLAKIERGDVVLDVGTGSGYQAAVLAELGAEVYSIEIIEPLAKQAGELLQRLGYAKVTVRAGDGYRGWPEHAPFDAVILAAAPLSVPESLEQQLKIGGRLVLPVGKKFDQRLLVITRTQSGFEEEVIIPVAFVPMTGEAQE
jgi:protein-L-isoaspartate(D-aspartate) O-methyltransferase